MPEPLKNLYSQQFFEQLSSVLDDVIPGFDTTQFVEKIFDSDWEQRELKERMKHIANVLHDFMPNDYILAVSILSEIADATKQTPLEKMSLEFMFLPQYIETFGLDHFDDSVWAMEQITPFASCEFAVRPFIVRYPEKMMKQMLYWSGHENHHLRRFASEGCRPRLPWAMALPEFKKNPEPVLPILEKLKADSSEYVRRSVANNLNDISKDHPQLVLELCRRWKGKSGETDWIVKHACRTLLKKAHPGALELFDYTAPDEISVMDFRLQKEVNIGGKLEFGFYIENNGDKPVTLRIEYAIDYMKSNGSTSRKIFKITENYAEAKSRLTYNRTQSFRDMTTRKHYPGKHRLAIIVNGREMVSGDFNVTA